MTKYFILFVFLLVQPVFSRAPHLEVPADMNKDFIFLLNINECIPCLNNAYDVAKLLISKKIPKQKIIFVIEERRKVLETNYINKLKNILDCDKITILWDSKLFDQFKEGANVFAKNSTLLIYNKDKNAYDLNILAKYVSPAKISPYLN